MAEPLSGCSDLAPSDWAYHGFPVERGEELSLDDVALQGIERITRADATGEYTLIGPVLHWAHRFVSSQGSDGGWPAAVNARTGELLGERRTWLPSRMLATLGDFLDSSEFDHAVERATRGSAATS